MSAANLLNTKAAGYAALAIVAAAAVYFIGKKIAGKVPDALGAVGAAVNPLSPENLAYRGASAVGGAIAGRDDWSLGSWFYDVTHEEYDPNATTQPVQPATTRQAGAWDSFWNTAKDIFTP